MSHRKRHTDIGVELLRVVGCLLVICAHVRPPYLLDGGALDSGRLLITCLVADGVVVFWLITGFFLFRTKSYPDLLKRSARTIALPLLAIILLTFYFWGFVVEGLPLAQSVTHGVDDYRALLTSLLSWDDPFLQLGHIWYLFVYLLLMLLFPFLKGMASYLDERPRRWRVFLVASACLFLVNDVVGNALAGFSHHAFGGVTCAAIYVLWGHWLYQHRGSLRRRGLAIGAVAAFLAVNVLRMAVQRWLILGGSPSVHPLFWYTSFGLASALCLAVACLSLVPPRGEHDREPGLALRGIAFLGSCTFVVYLVHKPVIQFLDARGVTSALIGSVTGLLGTGSMLSDVALVLSEAAAVAAISLAITLLIKLLSSCARHLVSR